jgi:hypothetical protein
LRVLHGRLKAVFVALLATIILIGVLGPAIAVASDPPGLARFMNAIGRVESGGSYTAYNPVSGAYGKYQILPSNWRAWAGLYLGNPYAAQTPANQEFVAAAKFRALFRWLDYWRRVAYWWLTGSDRTSGWSTFATNYVNKVMTYYYASSGSVTTTAETSTHRYSEASARIAYSGSWRTASYAGYAGGAVRYATTAKATATFVFTGHKVAWYGPVGPTRGKARISIDGVYVKTVDLYRSSFTARTLAFGRSWTAATRHTLEIEVVGTSGHPMVAIDELVVTD